MVRYGVSADEAHRFGLPCGGTLELVLEFAPALAHLDQLLACLGRGSLVRRDLNLRSGEASLCATGTPELFSFDGQRMLSTLGPGYRLLLIGGGALAEYLATMALFNGFNVSLCDPRPEYTAGWAIAGVNVLPGMPDDVVRAFAADIRSAIVAVSHDPKLDDLALLEALHSPAFYIGAIGSRRNSQLRRERLIEHFGESETSLQRLHGPIGIYIGSKTPAEIAVSVMAEILAAKKRRHPAWCGQREPGQGSGTTGTVPVGAYQCCYCQRSRFCCSSCSGSAPATIFAISRARASRSCGLLQGESCEIARYNPSLDTGGCNTCTVAAMPRVRANAMPGYCSYTT